MQKIAKKSPSWQHPTTLPGYIFATKACIDNRENVLSSNISSTCPHNMVNFGLLAAEIVSLVWGTRANFNGFRVLASLLHGTLVVGVTRQTNFAALNTGRHLYSAGWPLGIGPHFWFRLISILATATNTSVLITNNCARNSTLNRTEILQTHVSDINNYKQTMKTLTYLFEVQTYVMKSYLTSFSYNYRIPAPLLNA